MYRHSPDALGSFEKLPEAASYLKPGHTLEALGRIALRRKALRRRAGCHKPSTSCLPASRPPRRHAEHQEEGCGNACSVAKRRKPQTRFPSFSTALGNRSASPTFPQPRMTILPFPNQNQKPERSPSCRKPQLQYFSKYGYVAIRLSSILAGQLGRNESVPTLEPRHAQAHQQRRDFLVSSVGLFS